MKEERKFVLSAFHCSGGHGDTFSILGVFDDLSFVMARIRNLQCGENRFQMDSIDHGFFVYWVDLNQPYLSRSGANCVCAVRFQYPTASQNLEWKEEWFSQLYFERMKESGYAAGIFVELR